MTDRTIRKLPGIYCPLCGEERLRIVARVEIQPVGTYSVAGSQVKFGATRWPWLVCDGCGLESRGERD